MTMHKEVLLNFSELGQLSIPCAKCKTKILLDCRDQEANVPEKCPACGRVYEPGFRSTLHAYRDAWRKLVDPDAPAVMVRVVSDD